MSRRLALSATLVASALCAGSFLAGRAVSDEPPAGMPPDFQKMMEEWEKMKAPGPQHEVLKGLEGSWVGEGTWTDMGMSSTFREEVNAQLVFGGRFLRSGSSMSTEASGQIPAMSMSSVMFLGFDNIKQKYVLTMLGDWSTSIGTSEGTYDPATKALTMTGEEVMSPDKKRKFRMVQTIRSADEFLFEMYFEQPDGKESKAGEGVYKRKPAGPSQPQGARQGQPCPPGTR